MGPQVLYVKGDIKSIKHSKRTTEPTFLCECIKLISLNIIPETIAQCHFRKKDNFLQYYHENWRQLTFSGNLVMILFNFW